MWVAAATGIFCVVRGIFDLRAKRYVWGAAGLVLGFGLMLMPVPTHAVKIDLPVNTGR